MMKLNSLILNSLFAVLALSVGAHANAQNAMVKSPGCIRNPLQTNQEPIIAKKIADMGGYVKLLGLWEKRVFGVKRSVQIAANKTTFWLKYNDWQAFTFQVCDDNRGPRSILLYLDSSPFNNHDRTIEVTMGDDSLMDMRLDNFYSLNNVPMVKTNDQIIAERKH